ncbi:metal-dependent hydrolase [Actinomyces slackii]|uniref:Alanyl-tRNA synthetase n=1 Tax=Actinomyces slackii TaxID=52774 RepID=A0A448KBY3_9ACTO|nr:metal-dependent hydrolase [Actinomyces slackii]VEG74445.1 alanyl-tRNA synthetase [Actinomyces slackii]
MTLPSTDTIITYPSAETRSQGVVIHVEPLPDGRSAVLLDRTAAHPVDTAWPDQPADRAALHTEHGRLEIIDLVTGGIHEDRLHLGADLPVRTGTEGWVFVVAHIIDGAAPGEGSTVRVEVDAEYRAALSAGHTACHLAALALDAALANQWTKPAPVDALGNPAFDSLAIRSSRIGPYQSDDVYRLGKSLRRKGFPATGFNDLERITEEVNGRLATWIAGGGAVRIAAPSPGLSGRRSWKCRLPEGDVSIPCGGTHVSDLAELGAVTITLDPVAVQGATEITMRTTAGRSHR